MIRKEEIPEGVRGGEGGKHKHIWFFFSSVHTLILKKLIPLRQINRKSKEANNFNLHKTLFYSFDCTCFYFYCLCNAQLLISIEKSQYWSHSIPEFILS